MIEHDVDLKIVIKECENYEQLNFLAEIFIFNEKEEQWAMMRALELIQDEYVFFETSEFCQESMITLDVNGQ